MSIFIFIIGDGGLRIEMYYYVFDWNSMFVVQQNFQLKIWKLRYSYTYYSKVQGDYFSSLMKNIFLLIALKSDPSLPFIVVRGEAQYKRSGQTPFSFSKENIFSRSWDRWALTLSTLAVLLNAHHSLHLCLMYIPLVYKVHIAFTPLRIPWCTFGTLDYSPFLTFCYLILITQIYKCMCTCCTPPICPFYPGFTPWPKIFTTPGKSRNQ